ncbi:hypothetical protein C5167_002415, partial [Papaver somniferum]
PVTAVALGGRPWIVQLRRRDAKNVSKNDENTNLPHGTLSLSGLITSFSNKGFTTKNMIIGLDLILLVKHDAQPFEKTNFPTFVNDNNLAPLDATSTFFDITYYKNLVSKKGILHSGQEISNGGSTDAQVTTYSNDNPTFLTDFVVSMMGNLGPLTGSNGEIRTICMETQL